MEKGFNTEWLFSIVEFRARLVNAPAKTRRENLENTTNKCKGMLAVKRSHRIITARQPITCIEQPLTGFDVGMPVDSFCIALVYDRPLDEQLLIDGLQQALDQNPYFSGRLFGIGSTLPLAIPNNEGALFTCNTFAGNIPSFDIDQPLKPHLCKFAHGPDSSRFDHHTPLLQVQVTNFANGCILSIAISHALCDGTSMLEFMQSWSGHILRKSPRPQAGSNRRDLQQMALGDGHMPSPLTPVIAQTELPPMLTQPIETTVLRLPASLLDCLYEKYWAIDGQCSGDNPSRQHLSRRISSAEFLSSQTPSRQDLVAAFVYLLLHRSRDDQRSALPLSIVCNIRKTLQLPTTYLGNAVILRHMQLRTEQLQQADIPGVARLIRNLYSEITATALRLDLAFWQKRVAEGTDTQFMPVATHLALNGGVLLDNMSRFAFYELDFGAGKPVWIDTPPPPLPARVMRGILMLPAPPSHPGIDLHVSLPVREMAALRTLLGETDIAIDNWMQAPAAGSAIAHH